MRTTTQLRSLFASTDLVVAPGAYDGITARLIAEAGYSALYMTGAGTSVSRGFPDFGLLTMSEMVENAGMIARSVSIPLISDADTGYGNELNVTRTVREFEGRGVAGIHIEDQVAPKRCGHVEGKEVVDRLEFIAKIRAAVAAKRDPDFVVIARTDARGVVGFDEAVARANAALGAGADMAFIEAPQSLEELAAIPRLVKGPCLLNAVPGGKTPALKLSDVRQMGYKLAILPGVLLGPVIEACDAALRALKDSDGAPSAKAGAGPAETFRRFGSEEWDALRTRFLSPVE